MTQPPPPPLPTPPPHPPTSPATAKPGRPWFQKKRVLIPAAVIAVIGIGSAVSGGSSGTSDEITVSDNASGDTETASNDAQDSGGQPGTADNPVAVGTSVQNKSAKYTVTGVEVLDSLGPYSSPPAGRWVAVTVTVENVKDETIQVSSSDFTLEVNGFSIDASSEAYLLDNAFSYDDLSPTLTKSGVIVFDVPPEAAGQGVIKGQALFSTDEPVYLSLT